MIDMTDEQMHAIRATSRPYTLVVLGAGPNYRMDGARAIVWEHVRRCFALRAEGVMPLIFPVGVDGLAGVCILTVDHDEARRLMADDPGVAAGIFTLDVYDTRGTPGSALP